jgi:tyrosyl-tRNA synthetase
VPLVNNADWFTPWSFIDFLREIGVHFRVNQMLAKDSVRARLEEREQGISYTEFSYMLIQAFDFLHLYEAQGCSLQIGGSDQWGNITAGVELIRRKIGAQAYGLTLPLLLNASGQKLGKTEQGAVWLNAERLSPYEFYQYWVRQEDADVINLLKKLTFLSQERIAQCEAELAAGKNKGQLQQLLAKEVTDLVHGPEETQRAIRASKMLFGEQISDLSDQELSLIFADVPSSTMPRSDLDATVSLIEVITSCGLIKSRNEARRMVSQGAIYVNNVRVEDAELRLGPEHLASESALVLRSGKKNYHLIKFS